ncbi:alpha/beta fold hydrolase [Sediminitomix flava]|uniref:Pimeloyl-ACP methyl ester carboxylesterase n=1 Tax=Sediminitomix flava TaxID=379075 RepID=A0A315ZTD1_SEDFL|nr:alpha/beta hydrolase [Sediminitomix flava]PWJ38484.1 pimeloyl-ACP methyl ester carboxylesterase [Sediminitomix flava]
MKMRTSDEEMLKSLKSEFSSPKVFDYKVGDKNMHYIQSGNKNAPLLLFVHGAPGSLDAFKQYMENDTLNMNTLMISVDRSGYGKSDFGVSEPSIEKQAELIQPILEKHKDKKIILVGHSYGGPIICRILIDYPNYNYGTAYLLAPAISPELEKMFWINKPADSPIFKWMIPKAFKVANDEKMVHAKELELMDTLWQNIKTPIKVYQGKKDRIVDPKNAEFAKEKMINTEVEVVYLEEEDHFIPWTKFDLIKNELLKSLH